MPRVKHTEEFKREAVAQVVESRRRRGDGARACGVSGTTLQNWIKEFAPEFYKCSPAPPEAEPESELVRLKREVAELREENRFLRKGAAYFAKEHPRGTR
jgi:transposase